MKDYSEELLLVDLGENDELDPAENEDSFSFEELDFELEIALERFGTLRSADRILRAKNGLADASALIVRRYQPIH